MKKRTPTMCDGCFATEKDTRAILMDDDLTHHICIDCMATQLQDIMHSRLEDLDFDCEYMIDPEQDFRRN